MYQQSRGFNPVDVLQKQAWMSQQLPMDTSMDIDMFATYDSTMAFESPIYNQFAQAPDLYTMSWPDAFDYINPSAISKA
jgi:hypothetical protein